MNIFEIILRPLFANLFFSFADGEGAGGGDGSGGDDGSSSSDVNSDVKPETHFADGQGVPYYNRVQELQRKLDGFKDVDLEKFGRLKDYDPDEVEKALEFKNKVYSDPKKLAKVLDAMKDQQSEDGKQGVKDPELAAAIQRLERLEAHLQGQGQNAWMEKYDSSVSDSIAQCLKDPNFKELGGNLSEFEKKAVAKFVDDAYQADAAKGRAAKLSLKDVPSVVQGVLKMVADNRKVAAGGIRRDNSPAPIRGSGSTGAAKKGPMSDEDRVQAGVEFLKESEAGRNPAS